MNTRRQLTQEFVIYAGQIAEGTHRYRKCLTVCHRILLAGGQITTHPQMSTDAA